MSTPPRDDEIDSAEPAREPRRVRKGLIIFAVVLVIALVATLAGGSLGGSPSGSNTSQVVANSSVSTESCTTSPAGSEVRVTIYGSGEAACNEFNQGASKSTGDFWRTASQSERLSGQLVCSMSKGGSLLMEVRDTGEHFYGNKICASLTAKGWHAAEGPGAKIEREDAKRKAEQERTAAAERQVTNEQEAAKRQREQLELEKEEAVQHHREDLEHKKEEREHAAEAAKQQQELAAENRRNEEETKRAEREAHGE
jgi:flagellar biosynthesis GTPase FlhF